MAVLMNELLVGAIARAFDVAKLADEAPEVASHPEPRCALGAKVDGVLHGIEA